MSGAQQNNHPARSLMMKRLESVAFENNQLKHQLSQVTAENGSLRLDIQRNVKEKRDLQDKYAYDTMRLQALLDATVANYNTSLKDLDLIKEERNTLKAEVVDMQKEMNKIWVLTARICRGEQAAEQLERELGLS